MRLRRSNMRCTLGSRPFLFASSLRCGAAAAAAADARAATAAANATAVDEAFAAALLFGSFSSLRFSRCLTPEWERTASADENNSDEQTTLTTLTTDSSGGAYRPPVALVGGRRRL